MDHSFLTGNRGGANFDSGLVGGWVGWGVSTSLTFKSGKLKLAKDSADSDNHIWVTGPLTRLT